MHADIPHRQMTNDSQSTLQRCICLQEHRHCKKAGLCWRLAAPPKQYAILLRLPLVILQCRFLSHLHFASSMYLRMWPSSICAHQQDDFGGPSFGVLPAEELYGPEGWCEARQPRYLIIMRVPTSKALFKIPWTKLLICPRLFV